MALIEIKKIYNNIDYDKLAKLITESQDNSKYNANLEKNITNALKSYSEYEKSEIDRRNLERRKLWKQKIGLLDVPENSKWIKRKAIELINSLILFKTFVFYKKEYAKEVKASFMFMAMISSFLFFILELAFLALSIIIVYIVVKNHLELSYLSFIIPSLVFAKLMHIIGLEIDQMKDNEMINMIFSSLMAFIAALFTVLSFIRSYML